MDSKGYVFLWNKYRPAILQLMSASIEDPQEYKMSAHEFRAINARERAGFAFKLEASKGKALNNIRTSPVAQDLLHVLQQSRRASELMNEATFELSMDRNFVLHVNRREEEESAGHESADPGDDTSS